MNKLLIANFTIARLKNVLPMKIKITLYNSLFRSHLEYSILTLGNLPKYKIKPFFSLQKKCIRNIAGKDISVGTGHLFGELNLLKIQDLFTLNCNKFMFKILHGKAPRSFSNMFPTLSGENRSNSFSLPSYKGKFIRQFPSNYLPKVWNSGSLELRRSASMLTMIKTFCNLCRESYMR